MNILSVEHLRKQYHTPAGALSVLRDVTFDVSPHQSVAITGPSGSGKTTLLNIIASLESASGGKVLVAGEDVLGLSGQSLQRYRSGRIGLVFQDHRLLPQLTALENVQLPTLAPGAKSNGPLAGPLLERVGLAQKADTFAWKLSGGERQRVAIARAIVNGATLLLCDEPTGNLDRENAQHITDLILELVAERSLALVLVTHNPQLAARCTRHLSLSDGVLLPA